MDVVRSCYRTEMRFGPNGPVVPVRWFFARKGAKFFPGHHLFGSSNYASYRGDYPGVGEVRFAPREWDNGARPAGLDGKSFCGTLLQFEGALTGSEPGLPANAEGVPFCCLGVGFGGVLLDGAAAIDLGRRLVAAGGVLLDGAATIDLGRRLIGNGGLAAGGAAELAHSTTIAGNGGLLLDGLGIKPEGMTGFGGLLLDGAADLVHEMGMTAAGGLLLDGSKGVQTTCSTVPIPLQLGVTVQQDFDCVCLVFSGIATYTGSRWEVAYSACGGDVLITLQCTIFGFYCELFFNGTLWNAQFSLQGGENPWFRRFRLGAAFGPCDGTVFIRFDA